MCTVNEDAGDLFLPDDASRITTPSDKCMKCRSEPGWVVVQKKHTYCRSCFDYRVNHKIRSNLGKCKLMRPSDVVLVGFSGSPAALTLLHALHRAANEDGHKKIQYQIVFCYIDDGCVLNKTEEERHAEVNQNKALIESRGFQFYTTSLERVFSLEGGTPAKNEAFIEMFNRIKSITSKEDMLLKLRMKLLVEKAHELKCNKLFTCESQNQLAVKLLTSIALGRGEQLAQETGFSDTRYTNLTVLRPLMEVEDKEIACYNLMHNLPIITRTNLTTGQPPTASISRLTDEFLRGLNEEFPSTVPIVFRTAEKLSTSSDTQGDTQKCLLCEGVILAQDDSSYSATQATKFSHKISNLVPRENGVNNCEQESEGKCCGSGECGSKTINVLKPDQLSSCFCYGCLLIITELQSLDYLPRDVQRAAMERVSLETMREKISDFLL